jgi:hypothetical protein
MTYGRCLRLTMALLVTAFHVVRADVSPVGPEFQANTFTPGPQTLPVVAADATGGFVVVWQSGSYSIAPDGSRTGVFSQRHAANGMRLGGETRVNTYTLGPQGAPAIGMAPTGEFVVAWTGGTTYGGYEQDGSASGVFVQRYDGTGMPAGPEFRANTYTPRIQARPAVAVDGGGGFVVVWESGNYFLASQDGSRTGIFGQRYDASGAPLGTEFQVNTYTTDNQRIPAVAADTAGNFVVVWQSGSYYGGQDGSGSGVFGQRFSSTGASVGPEFQVNTYTTGYQGVPAVAMDDGGRFVVVWQSQQTGSGYAYAVVGRQFDAAGIPAGDEFAVGAYTTGSQSQPAVAADGAGNFVVVWDAYDYPPPDGSSLAVFAQHFASTGDPLSPEFQVNTYTTGAQSRPDIARAGTSDFVIVWQSGSYSTGQDGSGTGVFGQRFQTTGVSPPARVAGTRLRLTDDAAAPIRKRLMIWSRDAGIDLGSGDGSSDDPTLTGARVRVRSATFDDTYVLPAANWSVIGQPGANRGFSYRDRSLLAGPIRSVRLHRGKLRVTGQGAQLGHALGTTNPDPVSVTVQTGVGGKRYCLGFGGKTLFQPGRTFKASGAPTPTSCGF